MVHLEKSWLYFIPGLLLVPPLFIYFVLYTPEGEIQYQTALTPLLAQ